MIGRLSLRDPLGKSPRGMSAAGTPAIAEAIGLGAAVDYLTELGMENVQRHEQEITAHAMEQLQAVPELTIYGPEAARRGGVVSFTLADIHAHDLASILDQEVGVAIRAGHHCAQPLLDRLGLVATARASFYVYSIPEYIDGLVQGVHKALRIFSL